MLSGRRHY